MKFLTILTVLLCTLRCFSQENIKFKIISINRYSDGVLLRGIDSVKNDTTNIISVRDNKLCFREVEKIKVGNSYLFYVDRLPQSQAYLTDNFQIKIKTTVVWRPKDGTKNIPIIAKNTNGEYILKQKHH